MLSGGIADKIGNGFEGLWTMLQAMRLARDEISELHLEPIATGAGFEFKVDGKSGGEWHQCKRRSPGTTWTMNALQKEGFFEAAAGRWRIDPNLSFFLVTLDGAKPLSLLADKARLVDGVDNFRLAVNESRADQTALGVLKTSTGFGDEDAWKFLKRIQTESASEQRLRHNLTSDMRQFAHGDSADAVRSLKEFLDESLTHRITSDAVRAGLRAKGLRLRDANLDPTAQDKFDAQNRAYAASFGLFGVEGRAVPRATARDLAIRLVAEPQINTIVVTGAAGAGKSGVLRQMAEELTGRSVPCLRVRIDRSLDCATPDELGERIFGVEESPCRTLSMLASGARAVLVVDQLDAVSEVSGRQAAAKDLIFALLDDAARYPGLAVAIGCRSYDFENDRRFSVIGQGEYGTRVEVPALNFDAEIAPFLRNCDIDPNLLTATQRTLAELPLNLVLLVELQRTGGLAGVSTSTTAGLFDALIRRRSQQLAEAGVVWSVEAALGALAQWMSDQEALEAPGLVLGEYARAGELLTSFHLLVPVEGGLRFFHDSLFDYAFARDFVRRGATLIDWLTGREQLLFRRTQVRQVLDLLRASGARQYLDTLHGVLGDPRVRMHIKDMTARWLAMSSNPTASELAIILAFDDVNGKPPPVVERALLGPEWVVLLAAEGHIARWLNNPSEERRRFALWLLSFASKDHAEVVAEALRASWIADPTRAESIRHWMRVPQSGADDAPLADLYCDLIAASPAELFPDNGLPRETEIGQWVHKGSDSAARIYAAWVSRWFSIHPTGNPFGGRFGDNEHGYWLSEIAHKNPEAYLTWVLPLLQEAMAREVVEFPDRPNRYSSPFYRDAEDDDDEDDGAGKRRPARKVFPMARAALVLAAEAEPNTARRFLAQLDIRSHDAALHLYLAAIAANAELHDLLAPLRDNPDVFIAGVEGLRWTSIAEALATCWSLLSNTDRAGWEVKILDYWPELEEARRVACEVGEEEDEPRRQHVNWRLQANGVAQRAILTTIGRDRLSPVAARRLAELDRKFKNEPIPAPHRTRAGYVRSPIAPETAKRMGVNDWLSAVSRYQSPSEREWTDDGPVGGSEQLARILEIWCKEHPVDGANLLQRFPPDTLQTYFRAAVAGLRDSAADPQLSVEIARFAAGLGWEAENNPFPRFVHGKSETISDDFVFEAILGFARNVSAGEREEHEDGSRDTSLEAILSQADHAAFNFSLTLQGEALEALGDGIEHVPSRLPAVAVLVSELAKAAISPGIRCCLVPLAHSIAVQDADRGLTLLDEITSTDALGLATRLGMELVVWSLFQRPELGNQLVERMLASADERVRPAALWVLGRHGCRNDASAERFKSFWKSEPLARRMAARLAVGWCKDNESLEPRSIAWLQALFDDEDESVRKEAAAYGREVLGPDLADRASLATKLAGSRAFITDPDDLLAGLREAGAVLPEVVIAAAKAYFAGQDDPASDLNKRGRPSGFSLTETVLAAYRHLEDDARYRKDALDIIDAMVLRDSHGIRNEIGALER